jgi:rSAM/selenodomain-associated transferase 1
VTTRSVGLAIMAKLPEAGAVKTRLSPPLTAAQAADLARAFLLDTIELARAVPGVRTVLAYSPASAREAMRALAGDLELLPQRGVDLGARMQNALADLLARGHDAALVIGTDLPGLPVAWVREAAERVAHPAIDLIVGPGEDGGYYLIGMKRLHAALFEAMPWSTPSVLGETMRRAEVAGLHTVLLPRWSDVDTPADLERLRASMARGEGATAVHTRALLEVWQAETRHS